MHRSPAASTFAFLYMSARCDAVVLSAHVAATLGCCSGPAVIRNVASGTSRPGHCPTLPDVPARYGAAVFSADVTAILGCCSGVALIRNVCPGERFSEARRPGRPGRRRRPSDGHLSTHRHPACLPPERMAEGATDLGAGGKVLTRYKARSGSRHRRARVGTRLTWVPVWRLMSTIAALTCLRVHRRAVLLCIALS